MRLHRGHTSAPKIPPNDMSYSPWSFADTTLESKYTFDTISTTVDRLRMPGKIYISVAWIMRIPFLWSLMCGSYTWTAEEAYTTFLRLGLLVFYSIMCFFVYPGQVNKRRIGIVMVWIMRIVVFPMELGQELGVPQHSSQLILFQVHYLEPITKKDIVVSAS
jgi:hypothetical protein